MYMMKLAPLQYFVTLYDDHKTSERQTLTYSHDTFTVSAFFLSFIELSSLSVEHQLIYPQHCMLVA